MKKITFLLVVILIAFVGETYAQGVTTSAIGGKVTDNTGGPLPGATVVAVHQPSGTTYGATTDFDGFYRISGMRTGGPYRITISYVGFQSFMKDGVFLQLGQSERISTQLVESSTALEEVVIQATNTGVFNSNKTGAETNISQRDIQTLPQTSRSIADFVRITPQAQISEGDDGFSISLAGQNNRYNAIYIDGAISNDVFGLAGSGTNGGQTGVNPFSVDAIETFQVNLAPFDVKISGFAGGAISAVTRSGSNQVQGSAYSFFRNQDLAGKTPPDLTRDEREKLDDFSSLTYGVRLGGPIIENKLFFFVNYERQDEEIPQPYSITRYTGDARGVLNTDGTPINPDLTQQNIDLIRNTLISRYGYDPGVLDQTRTLVSDKITARFDYNVNDKNKLAFTYRLVSADNLEARSSTNTRLGFSNGSESFKTNTNSGSLEWNFQNDKVSNSLILGYTRVRDDRDPDGSPFPSIIISDGLNRFRGQGIQIGSEQFSTANLLDQDIFTLTNNFEVYKGNHTITFGTHNEYSSVKNLFFPSNYGLYVYDSVGDFVNDNIDEYERGYSLIGSNAVGDDSAGASEFDLFQMGFYVQDEVNFSDNFKLTAGLRFDIPYFEDGRVNEDFNTNAVAQLEAAGKDLQGARVGKAIKSKVHISPRVGFNWDVNGERKTQIRGGFGIFTSRIPLVWPAGTYNNNGVTGGFTDEGDLADAGIPLAFNPNVNQQPVHVQPNTGGFGGNVDLFAPDFMLPQRFRVNAAIDQTLPLWGLIASVDFLWNENITDIYYQNLNIGAPTGNYEGADNRPFYSRNRIAGDYNRVILATNTSGGESWNAAITIRKPFENGFQGSISYSYGESNIIFDGTSSQNSSQWRNQQSVNGKNSTLPVTRSDFNQGHRIISNLSYELDWNENFKTTIGLFYEGSQSAPYSFVYNEGRDLLGDDSRDNALIYIPRNQSEINLVPLDVDDNGTIDFTPTQQWEALNEFIEGNEYLRKRRGQYAERNGEQGPWSHVIDLRFLQDFALNIGNNRHAFQFSFDIFNFTNLLNKDWGKRKFVPNNIGLIETVNTNTNTSRVPDFTFNPDRFSGGLEDLDDDGIQSSRWQMQIGLRYLFN